MFKRYHRYEELTAHLQTLAADHPDIFRLTSLGQSYQGREIWCMEVTRRETGPHDHKPAVWVDGNIHATEFSASSACLHLLRTFAERDGKDRAVTLVLDTRTYYVVPRVNPDGAEWALGDHPVYLRSSVRPYPYDEEPIDGLQAEDVDGDGRILMMRIEDSNGAWTVHPDEPRLLVRREPGDLEGPFYRLMPEGRLLGDYDGAILEAAPRKEKLDLNRNFPSGWRTESEQPGAGPFPGSEPETRAVVEFISSHPNICHALTFHTYSGVLLRPYSTKPDEKFPAEDLWLYEYFGNKGTELTGYPALSIYHDFRYHPEETITGAFDDWAYDHLGVLAWTVEIWSPHRQAGITKGFDRETKRGGYRFIDWWRQHPVEEDLALLRWNDEVLEGAAFENWRAFTHPQLGEVEIGGWDFMYAFRNPPPRLLERELEPLTEWVLWHGLTTPRLAVLRQRVSRLGEESWRLELVIENRGWLSTTVTKKAEQRKIPRPIQVELKLPEGVELSVGKLRTEAGQLQGKAHLPTSPVRLQADGTPDRVRLEWVVRGPAGAAVEVTIAHDRAGRLSRKLSLG